MTRKFFSGSTLDQAVMMAARHYEIDPQELAYRQIEKRHGFLRTRKAVMIAVDPEQPRKEPRAADEAPPAERAAAPAAGPEPSPAPVEPAPVEPAPVSAGESGNEAMAESEVVATAGGEAEDELDDDGFDDDDEPDDDEFDDDDEPDDDEFDDDYGPEEHEPDDDDESPEDETLGARAVEEPHEGVAWQTDVTGGHEEPEPAAEPEPEPAAEPAAAAADREPEVRGFKADEELLDAAERASQTLLRFAGIDAQAKAQAGAERIEIEIEGPDESVLVVEGGKGLLSIQHLLPRMLRGMTDRSSFVRVDSDGFHEKRKERLVALALKEADAASRGGGPRTLPPMAPDERRIVHLALKDSPTVVTESRGTGLHKRVVIRPADGFDEPGDVEARHGF